MPDLATGFFYDVTIDGFIPLGTWSKIEGLGYEYTVTEYKEGGQNGYTHKLVGPCKYTNVRLTRAIDTAGSLLVSVWLASVQVKVIPTTMSIAVLNSAGDQVTSWNLLGAVPVKWTGPSLDIYGNQLATETLEVAYEQILGLGMLGGLVGGALDVSASVSVGI